MYVKKIKGIFNFVKEETFGFHKLHDGVIPEYDNLTMDLTKEIVEREDGDYEYKYTAVISKEKIEKSISALKKQLSNTDYKVIKNMEALQCGLELPYEPNALHNERQAIRDKINKLEELLK